MLQVKKDVDVNLEGISVFIFVNIEMDLREIDPFEPDLARGRCPW